MFPCRTFSCAPTSAVSSNIHSLPPQLSRIRDWKMEEARGSECANSPIVRFFFLLVFEQIWYTALVGRTCAFIRAYESGSNSPPLVSKHCLTGPVYFQPPNCSSCIHQSSDSFLSISLLCVRFIVQCTASHRKERSK